MPSTKSQRKKVVEKFFGLIKEGRQKESLRYFAPDCRQHNPYVRGGMEALFDAMAAVQQESPEFSDPDLSVKRVVSEGDLVVAHTELLNSKSRPSEGGLRQAHLFRFGSDGKIAEYWDITQSILPEMPNAANAFDERSSGRRRV
jgi:predicted SnoaL-like aldol condensation-catalyzing enzyme